jgi:hypothetical protein
MAAKKITKKSTKKREDGASARKGAKKITKKSAKRSAKKRGATQLLSTDERLKLLKPREDFDETIERFVREWESYRALRVPGLTAARMRSLLKKSERAAEKEAKVREKYERALAPLADARRLAQHDAFKALLLANKAVKLQGEIDAGVLQRFAFLAEALTTNPGGGDRDEAPKPTA